MLEKDKCILISFSFSFEKRFNIYLNNWFDSLICGISGFHVNNEKLFSSISITNCMAKYQNYYNCNPQNVSLWIFDNKSENKEIKLTQMGWVLWMSEWEWTINWNNIVPGSLILNKWFAQIMYLSYGCPGDLWLVLSGTVSNHTHRWYRIANGTYIYNFLGVLTRGHNKNMRKSCIEN